MPPYDHTEDDKAALAELLRETTERDGLPISLRFTRRPRIILAALAMAALPTLVAAQAPTGCELGQAVDDRGIPGTIIGERNGLCLIKYKDGRTQRWVSPNDLTVGPSTAPADHATSPEPPASAGPAAPAGGVKVLKPTAR